MLTRLVAKFTDLPLELLLEIWRKLKRRRDRQNFRMSSKSVFLAHPQYYGPSTVLHLRTSETAVEFADDVNNFKRLFPAVQFGQISAIILEFELDGFTLANWDSLIRALAFQHKVKRLQCQFALGMPGEWLYISRAVAAMPTCVSLVFDPCTLNVSACFNPVLTSVSYRTDRTEMSQKRSKPSHGVWPQTIQNPIDQ